MDLLKSAIRAGKFVEISKLITEQPALIFEELDSSYGAALGFAVVNKQKEIVNFLLSCKELSKGVNFTASKTGYAALHLACIAGAPDLVEWILAHPESDINIIDKKNWTALHYASFKGHAAVVRLLLADLSIDINLRNKEGRTALEICCEDDDADGSEMDEIEGLIKNLSSRVRQAKKVPVSVPEMSNGPVENDRKPEASPTSSTSSTPSRKENGTRQEPSPPTKTESELSNDMSKLNVFNNFSSTFSNPVNTSQTALTANADHKISETNATPVIPIPPPIVDSKPFDVFLSHDWGFHPSYENHYRVATINAALQKRGIKTWFDANQMGGDVTMAMANGIEQSKLMIVFVTDNYRNKVNKDDERDNCQKELRYAEAQLGSHKMLPVVMESSMRNPRDWKLRLGMTLAHRLYVADFSGMKNLVGTDFDHEMDKLYNEILKTIEITK